MAKILIATIQVNLVPNPEKATQIHLNCPVLKILPLAYHHSHFLAATLDFTSFFTMAFLRPLHPFLQLGCFGLQNCIEQMLS